MGPWNVNRGRYSVFRGLRIVIMGPWNVNVGPWKMNS